MAGFPNLVRGEARAAVSFLESRAACASLLMKVSLTNEAAPLARARQPSVRPPSSAAHGCGKLNV